MKGLVDALKKIAAAEVYVGVTEESAPREGEKVNNAQLVYVHTHGSPLRNIPPRPIIEPAIEADDNKAQISKELGEAAKALLDGNPKAATKFLNQAGQTGADAAKNWFDDPRNNWAPLKQETIFRKMGKKRGKKTLIRNIKAAGKDGGFSVEQYMALSDAAQPLVDTAAMKQAMKYTVKE
jgi:hypothetical protein